MIKLDLNKIPESEVRLLALTLLDGVRKFYSDPKNVAKFEEWQKARQNAAKA